MRPASGSPAVSSGDCFRARLNDFMENYLAGFCLVYRLRTPGCGCCPRSSSDASEHLSITATSRLDDFRFAKHKDGCETTFIRAAVSSFLLVATGLTCSRHCRLLDWPGTVFGEHATHLRAPSESHSTPQYYVQKLVYTVCRYSQAGLRGETFHKAQPGCISSGLLRWHWPSAY